ncbi:hypothetical protein EN829_036280 [Mesorhizobium sp. M00.F.Ca.ET.186.01.1.1]|nr:hypothetical protein EN829_036280 [Mesorhizobium sp. M00.F.Ca.ET.186.01.1.1]
MITIGQAPRQDIAPIVERHLAGRAAYQAAIEPLKDKVDVLLMDCMGYTEEARELVSELTGLPWQQLMLSR